MKGPRQLIWGLGGVLLLALAIAVTRPAAPIRADIGNADLRDLQAKGARIIDVRSPGEYSLGHIAGAENAPIDRITQTASGWDRNAAIVVYCSSGSRSFNAAQWLAANGFTKVYNLKAGLAAWDGQLTKDETPAATAIRTGGKPVFIDFFSPT